MTRRIEDYAVIGDLHTMALVGRDGSIDWLCVPRFDSGAVFAALLGNAEHGHWRLAPSGEGHTVRRRYRGETLVLETETTTDTGVLRVTDCMPPGGHHSTVVRQVECLRGRVQVEMELRMRFDYATAVPWVRKIDHRLVAVAGPDAMVLDTPAATKGRGMATMASFELSAGDVVPFVLTWQRSHNPLEPVRDAQQLVDDTVEFWTTWLSQCSYEGEWVEPVHRSLITLKALTYYPTGGVVAAPTTSLPEQIGGSRNWDYRYCWLRDTTFTLLALLATGFDKEAADWREWLLRAIAGDPAKLQIMYGVAGERRLPEWELSWLPGFEGSAPVRVGNGAVDQRQLDVYGEVLDALHMARLAGLHAGTSSNSSHPERVVDDSWPLQRALLNFLESHWREPDEGIWEVRGSRQNFVHSKVMAWVAMDRAVRGVQDCGLPGPAARWAAVRDEIKAEVLARGYNADAQTFTQAYESTALDAATLLIPLVGFLPADDPRVVGTLRAVEAGLMDNGFLRRYDTGRGGRGGEDGVDGLHGDEGAFLMCTFWLADNYALMGNRRRAREIFERLLALRNDVGLLAEEYDPVARRQLGNFPQAFSHTAMVNSAHLLGAAPAANRRRLPARHRRHSAGK